VQYRKGGSETDVGLQADRLVFVAERNEVRNHRRLGMIEMAFWGLARTMPAGFSLGEELEKERVKAKDVLVSHAD
jgi:hypothetical protein